MAQKTLQVHLRVTERQHAYMRERAESYDIPLSLLVLKAVEAYTRTYEDDVGDVTAVAVNYGVWRRVDSGLGDIEAVGIYGGVVEVFRRHARHGHAIPVPAGPLEQEVAQRHAGHLAVRAARAEVVPAMQRDAVGVGAHRYADVLDRPVRGYVDGVCPPPRLEVSCQLVAVILARPELPDEARRQALAGPVVKGSVS